MTDTGAGTIGGIARPHSGTASAVIVHISYRDPLAEGTGRGFCRAGRGFSGGHKIARARRAAGDALGIERPGYSPLVRLGSTATAPFRISFHPSGELVARSHSGCNRRGVGIPAQGPTVAIRSE